MSRYEVEERRGAFGEFRELSSSSLSSRTTHSEFPVKGSSRSWNMRREVPKLMARRGWVRWRRVGLGEVRRVRCWRVKAESRDVNVMKGRTEDWSRDEDA